MLEAKAFYGTPPPAEPVVSVINKNIPRADFLHEGCFKQNLNQFDDRHFGGVAAAHTSLDDTGVTAVAVGVFPRQRLDRGRRLGERSGAEQERDRRQEYSFHHGQS